MPENAAKMPSPDPNEKLVKVFDSEQESEVLVVKGLLDSVGIESDMAARDESGVQWRVRAWRFA